MGNDDIDIRYIISFICVYGNIFVDHENVLRIILGSLKNIY